MTDAQTHSLILTFAVLDKAALHRHATAIASRDPYAPDRLGTEYAPDIAACLRIIVQARCPLLDGAALVVGTP